MSSPVETQPHRRAAGCTLNAFTVRGAKRMRKPKLVWCRLTLVF
jgi:hypothetical protein